MWTSKDFPQNREDLLCSLMPVAHLSSLTCSLNPSHIKATPKFLWFFASFVYSFPCRSTSACQLSSHLQPPLGKMFSVSSFWLVKVSLQTTLRYHVPSGPSPTSSTLPSFLGDSSLYTSLWVALPCDFGWVQLSTRSLRRRWLTISSLPVGPRASTTWSGALHLVVSSFSDRAL